MAMKITFVVPGIPIAKQGDRSAIIKGKDGRTFMNVLPSLPLIIADLSPCFAMGMPGTTKVIFIAI